MAGRPDKARAALAQFAQIKDKSFCAAGSRGCTKRLERSRLPKSGSRDAIVEFRNADRGSDGKPAYDNPVHAHFNLGRAFDLASQPDSAIAEFEAYIATRYDGRFDDDQFALAGTHKRLGELYDAKGDREKAISHL